ncbi:helicase-related protein [Ideonella sp. A 288]|uniref:helicase-related protein n=1 Tax=Ideonella sp. A 288 TaxID=1962181 RepID=UPI000B4B9FF1|nr:helicase-related protein [Ideonella sp. A 288]
MTDTPPDTSRKPAPQLSLPNPRHVQRLPAGIDPASAERIRQAAYLLPQTLTPLDCDDLPPREAEVRFEAEGLILLQKALAEHRPSRWIAPDAMAAALRHLDEVGTRPGVRPLMAERTTVLDTLGLSRQGTRWDRLVSQALSIEVPGQDEPWSLAVAFRVPVAAQPVWDFYRTGDGVALRAALGPVPPHPQAAELRAHLQGLLARSAMHSPQQLDALLPRLQSECSTPQPLADLLAACTRAQDRWEHQVNEQATLAGLTRELAFQGYPDSFTLARQLQRTVTLYVGPPNSGKTHAAFERLAQCEDGAYLAPLRLLALEGRDRLVARGVPCSLLTGEENVPADGARVVSSTIEMVNTRRAIDVAVIDEAQMVFDSSRGWAWTQAIVGVPANEVIVICSSFAVSAIENLLGLCGERCTVRQFERKQHVELLHAAVPIAALREGDAVVAFSRRDVLMLRDQAAANGKSVSVIYGALPPEVRRREAERFAGGESQILVATDAIGMGLNLPIRRVLFSTLVKFDGEADRPLSVSEVHQIAGRAGRFGIHEEGFVGVLREAEASAARTLKDLLPRSPRAPRDFKAPVAPNPWHVETIADRLGKRKLREVLEVFRDQLALDNAHFAVADLDAMIELAGALDEQAAALPLRERFIYSQAPVDSRTPAQVTQFLDWAHSHARTGKAGTPWFLDSVDGHSRLDRMEQALRSCTLWLWLDLRFPGIYGEVPEVLAMRAQLNDGIERQLKGQRPLWQARGRPRH